MSVAAVHTFPIRVYYEDTDAGGVVYHANHLKFIERARSEWVRDLGVDQKALKAAERVFFVRRMEIDYLRSAFYDDLLEVTTRVEALGGSSATLRQEIARDGETIFAARVVIVFATTAGQPVRLPEDFRARVGAGTGG